MVVLIVVIRTHVVAPFSYFFIRKTVISYLSINILSYFLIKIKIGRFELRTWNRKGAGILREKQKDKSRFAFFVVHFASK